MTEARRFHDRAHLCADVERFRSIVVRRLGLQFDDAKLGFLGEVLQRRLEMLKQSSNAYLQDLSEHASKGELSSLAQELTVTETYFFRNHEQFRALADVVLPERMEIQARSKNLRFLSAGCASGEEAYSIAIVARETVMDPSWRFSVRAVDLNPGALERAGRGRYSAWALRETPRDAQRKWFRADGSEMILEAAARAPVEFEEANLAEDNPALSEPGAYDAIYCRNVMMYFAPEQARALLARLARALAPGGYLFIGHAETLRGLSDEFHLRHTNGTFYYQRRDTLAGPRTWSLPSSSMCSSLAPTAPSLPTFSNSWVNTIREASERVEALTTTHKLPGMPCLLTQPRWDRAHALDLLRRERFSEALAYVREMSPESSAERDILLLEAMLLAHRHQIVEALECCQRLLLIDELNAAAHYAFALCRESLGDCADAMEHDRIAIYLDPAFAMPRLHLGLLARRAGDRDSARRELAQALALLKREDASRLLLFGGGFTREALLALCGAALLDCGGSP